MSKVHKISIAVIAASLIFAVVFGLVTRSSYKYFDPNDAFVRHIGELEEIVEEVISTRVNSERVLEQLESADYAFIVTVKSNEPIHEATKTAVYIDKVIKGDTASLNKTVYIYEPNFLFSSKGSDECLYYPMNKINNLMAPGKQYLVFAYRVDYSDSYQKLLENYEYQVELDFELYSFPLEDEIKCIEPKGDMTYADIKAYDYFCFTQEQKDILEEIRAEVFDLYL